MQNQLEFIVCICMNKMMSFGLRLCCYTVYWPNFVNNGNYDINTGKLLLSIFNWDRTYFVYSSVICGSTGVFLLLRYFNAVDWLHRISRCHKTLYPSSPIL